jgi:hypothetical protein
MATASIEDLARRARFIFRGTVERLGAATMSGVPVSAVTAVVKVEEILLAPPVLGNLAGKNVTVELTTARTEDQGRHAVFFTDPWLYGDGVAVREIGRQELRAQADAREHGRLREQVAGLLGRLPDEELRHHLGEVEVVLVGRVVNTKPLDLRGQVPITEHEPQWWEASCAADAVEKGQVAGPTVPVLYAASMDVMWAQAPKLRVGQEGVWLLHRGGTTPQDPGLRAIPFPPGYVVLHPLDAHPREAAERIRRLLREGGGAPATSV